MAEIKKSTIQDNLAVFQEKLKSIYGNDFVIKPEGVIDNIATSVSLIKMDFEDQLLFLKQQLNPYTATGMYQDNLYSMIGLVRQQSTYTLVQRTISGTSGTVIKSGTLLIENTATKDQFKLIQDVTIGADGRVVGTFQSELIGAVLLPPETHIRIVTPIQNVVSIYYTPNNDINLGVDYETDEAFRLRFLSHQKSTNKLYTALLKCVDHAGDLKIIQNRGRQTYPDLPLHTMKITLFSAQTDQEIAETIFNHLSDGIDLDGDTIYVVKDISGEDVEIRFHRATSVPIYVKTVLVKSDGFSVQEAKSDALNAIKQYYESAVFVMGRALVANRFNSLLDEKPSIEYVCETMLSLDGQNWISVLDMQQDQVPAFSLERVEVALQ